MKTPAEELWLECGLPSYFLGSYGTNKRLDEFYKCAQAEAYAAGQEVMREDAARAAINCKVTDTGSLVPLEAANAAFQIASGAILGLPIQPLPTESRPNEQA